jgi:hypothetical protein
MPVNLPAPRHGSAQSQRPWGETRPGAIGPGQGFAFSVIVCFAAWAISRATLPPDLVMPVVATLFLAFAAAFSALAWWRGWMDAGDITYRDVAGALTLIGVCAAATIDPEQMIRLVQSRSTAAE